MVKCSLNGEDPYWGRVVSELGSAGVAFDIDRVVGRLRGHRRVPRRGGRGPRRRGRAPPTWPGRHVEIGCDLGLGDGPAAVLTTDLGYGYIDENRTTS